MARIGPDRASYALDLTLTGAIASESGSKTTNSSYSSAVLRSLVWKAEPSTKTARNQSTGFSGTNEKRSSLGDSHD
jgi:hypothetical protein